MEQRTLYARRTGAAVLGLLVATNLVPWLGLLAGEMAASDALALWELAVAFGAYVVSAALLLAAWLLGRLRGAAAGTRIARPRLLGLKLAILAGALNLLLAAVVLLLGPGASVDPGVRLRLFAVVWISLVLPVELLAAYCKGHASAPAAAAPAGR